jgi:Methyltransferase FkbM domain
MGIPLRFLMRLKKIRGLCKALDDHVSANNNLEKEINELRIYVKSLLSKVTERERQSELLAEELEAKRDGLPVYLAFSPEVQSERMAMKIFSLLRPMDVVNGRMVRRGAPNDGGYVMLDSPVRNEIAYSLGVGNDVSWDLDMATNGCTVYQYDHSIASVPTSHPNFKWFQLNVGTETDNDTITVVDAITRNGHKERQNIILKMDVEYWELDVLQSIDETTILLFAQIIVELHGIVPEDTNSITKIVTVLSKINKTHQVIHLHANNYGRLGIMGRLAIPGTFEVTYVRRRDHEFTECKKVFPTALDNPCKADARDYYLGPVGMFPY